MKLVLSFTLMLLSSTFALADDKGKGGGPGGGGGGGPREACKADVEKHCKAESAGTDRRAIGKCLRDHEKDLSDGCKKAIEAMRNRRGPGGGKPGPGGGKPGEGGGKPGEGGGEKK